MPLRCMLALSLLLMSGTGSALAQDVSNAEVDQTAKLAMLLGRGVGCGLDIDRANRMVGAWLDQTFPSGTARQDVYLDMFADSVRHHAALQRAGDTPDSCADVAEAFETMDW